MPEIKHSFTGGKMNKDVDTRLVPNGEYRDATNIQIRTTDSGGGTGGEGNAGMAQNIQGNIEVGSGYTLFDDNRNSTIIGSVADEKNNTGYFFVSSPVFDHGRFTDAEQVFLGDETSAGTRLVWSDSIIRHNTETSETEYVVIDRFAVRHTLLGVIGDYENLPTVGEFGEGWTELYVGDVQNFSGQVEDYFEASEYRVGMYLMIKDSVNNIYTTALDGEPGHVKIVDISTSTNTLILECEQTIDIPTDQTVWCFFYMPEGERVLNFNINKNITGINIIDNLLFWTDSYDEPKKINIDRCVQGTNSDSNSDPFLNSASLINGTRHTRLFVSDSSGEGVFLTDVEPSAINTDLIKDHVTVIRKSPKTAPTLIMSNTDRIGQSGFTLLDYNFLADDILPTSGSEKIITIPETVNYRINDIIKFTNVDNINNPVTLTSIVIETTATTITVKLTNIDEDLSATNLIWEVELQQKKPLFELKLGRFACRYQYENGEYSTFSPWSELAYLPGTFKYTPSKGYNMGMVNTLRRLTIKDFIPNDLIRPLDVKTVDILFKTTDNNNVYIIKTVRREIDNEWELFTSEEGENTGSLTLTSEMIHQVIAENQLNRVWDNVPRYALAQEITGNRLVYGNYTQGYDLNQQVGLTQYIKQYPVPLLIPAKSVKSLRSYKFGMVFGDQYGRETPVVADGFVSGDVGDNESITGDVVVGKGLCNTSNKFVLTQNWSEDPPKWIDYVKYYVKETSSEYYNLVMDRWYDAEDGNVWLSFPSVDRNKVDEETYLILKNEHGGQQPILEDARYKIIAIESEAPDYIKEDGKTFEKLRIPNTIVYGNGLGTGSLAADSSGVPDGLIEQKKIFVSNNEWDSLGLNKDYFKGVGRCRIVAEYRPGNTTAYANNNISYIQSEATQTFRSPWKKFSRVIDFNDSGDRGVIMSELFAGPEINAYNYFSQVTNTIIDIATNYLDIIYYLEFADTVIESGPEFDGRFFVKVEKDETLISRVLHEYQGDYVIESVTNVAYIESTTSNIAVDDPVEGAGLFSFASWNSNGFWNDFDTSGDNICTNLGQPGFENETNNFWNDWWNYGIDWDGDGSVRRTADVFIDGTRGSNVREAFGYWNDTTFENESFVVMTGPDGTDVSDDSFYPAEVAASVGSGFNISDNTLNGLSQGEAVSGLGEITLSSLGETWANGNVNATMFRNHMLTVGTMFRFQGDPNSEVYKIIESEWSYNVSSTYEQANGQLFQSSGFFTTFNYPIDLGKIANCENSDGNTVDFENIGDHRWSISTRFAKIDKATGVAITTGTGDTYGIDVETWDPRGSVYHNGLANNAYNGGSFAIEIVSFKSDDTLILEAIQTESACWETEPKIDTDLEIYYEASNSIPVRLNEESIIPFTSPSSKRSQPAVVKLKNINTGEYLNTAFTLITNDVAKGGVGVQIGSTGPNGFEPLAISDPENYMFEFIHRDGTVTSSKGVKNADVDENGVLIDLPNYGDLVVYPSQLYQSVPANTTTILVFAWNGVGINPYPNALQQYPDQSAQMGAIFSDISQDAVVTFTNPTGLSLANQGDVTINSVSITDFSALTPTTPYIIANIQMSGLYFADAQAVTSWNTGMTSSQGSGILGFSQNYYMSIALSQGTGWYMIDDEVWQYPIELAWHNCYAFGNGVESDRVRDDFNAPQIDNGIVASTTFLNYGSEHKKSGLIHSGIYNSTSGTNELNQFNMGEKITKDLNPSYGSIQRLKTRDTDVVVLTEDKVLKVLSNKDAVFNADGNPQLTATDKVLGQTIPFVGDYGISQNPESLAWDQYRMYFTDKQRGAVLRLSRDGLTPISNVGMKNWFRENFSQYTGDSLMIGSFDVVNGEYNLTLGETESDNAVSRTVSFNEAAKGWVSFKSFVPRTGLSVSGKYFTTKLNKLYKHHDPTQPRNSFYDTITPSSITVVFNDNPSAVKSFRALSYEGSQARVNKFEEENTDNFTANPGSTIITEDFTDGQYYNLNEQEGWYVSSFITDGNDGQEGIVPEFIKKENKWFNKIIGRSDPNNIDSVNLNNFTTQGLGTSSSVFNDIEIEQFGFTITDLDSGDSGGDGDIETVTGNAPYAKFTYLATNDNGWSGIKCKNLFNNITKEVGDEIIFNFTIRLWYPSYSSTYTSHWLGLSGIQSTTIDTDAVASYDITPDNKLPIRCRLGGAITSSALIPFDTDFNVQLTATMSSSDYDNDIKIEHIGAPLSQAAIILSGAGDNAPSIEVLSSDGTQKFYKQFDLNNVIVEEGSSGTTNIVDTGNFETGSFATNNDTMIDGWREHSAETNSDGFSYSHNIYSTLTQLINLTL